MFLKVIKIKELEFKDLKLNIRMLKIKELTRLVSSPLKVKVVSNPSLIEFFQGPLGPGRVYSLQPLPLLERRLADVAP